MNPLVFLVFSLILSKSYASVQDFCVADYAALQSPVGYACKDLAKVTVDDFVFSGLRNPGNITSINKIGLSAAFAVNFPGLNGLGVSLVRADFAIGGVVPMHSHPDATELVFIIEGRVVAGFIASNNKAYVKTLKKGDTMVFPQGLFHLLVNVGKTKALAYASFSSANPNVQTLETALFQNDLPSEILAKATLLDVVQIRKLKLLLGGTK